MQVASSRLRQRTCTLPVAAVSGVRCGPWPGALALPGLHADLHRSRGRLRAAAHPCLPPQGRVPFIQATALPGWPRSAGGNMPDCSQNKWGYFDAAFVTSLRTLVREREFKPALIGTDTTVLIWAWGVWGRQVLGSTSSWPVTMILAVGFQVQSRHPETPAQPLAANRCLCLVRPRQLRWAGWRARLVATLACGNAVSVSARSNALTAAVQIRNAGACIRIRQPQVHSHACSIKMAVRPLARSQQAVSLTPCVLGSSSRAARSFRKRCGPPAQARMPWHGASAASKCTCSGIFLENAPRECPQSHYLGGPHAPNPTILAVPMCMRAPLTDQPGRPGLVVGAAQHKDRGQRPGSGLRVWPPPPVLHVRRSPFSVSTPGRALQPGCACKRNVRTHRAQTRHADGTGMPTAPAWCVHSPGWAWRRPGRCVRPPLSPALRSQAGLKVPGGVWTWLLPARRVARCLWRLCSNGEWPGARGWAAPRRLAGARCTGTALQPAAAADPPAPRRCTNHALLARR